MYKCSFCDQTFPRKYLLKGHLTLVHDKEYFQYVCVECDFSAVFYAHYERHCNSKAHISRINKAANNS